MDFSGGYLRMLLSTLSAILLGKLLTAKGVERTRIHERGITRAGERVITTSRIFNDASSFN